MSAESVSLLGDLVLSRTALDRADEVRHDNDELDNLWGLPTSRLLELHGDHVAVDVEKEVTRVEDQGAVWLVLSDPTQHSATRPTEALFLGFSQGCAIFAVESDPQLRLVRASTLRLIGTLVNDSDADILTTAMALANWHRRHKHCSLCGERTVVDRGGWMRRCPVDESEHYPRTDPAAIVLVVDPEDRALLGRRKIWPEGWFSTLAGFVEPGEAAEATVVREVGEEAGVVVDQDSVEFLGSQPWPFPSSLMLGFHARALSCDEPEPDGEEIAEARWFTREELLALCESGEVKVPPRISIARHLIERWYGEQLPGDWSR